MKIAVIGSGAIGGLVAGYLKLKMEDVSLVGHADSVRAIKENGLYISGVRGNFNIKINISEKLNFIPELIILTTKTQDIDAALEDNLGLMQDTLILTTQNGVQADYRVAKYIPEKHIVSSIVMFGATYLEPGKVVHNFEGNWIIGKMFDVNPAWDEACVSLVLDKAFPTVMSENIKGMKYLKIFVNANNCIPAILGLSMQEAFSDLEISRISIGIWKEGFQIVDKTGIGLESLPGFPVENISKLISLPSSEAARIFSGMMTKLSKDPLYGSILQSIKRQRASEIDYINGEFVSLAQRHGLGAPLNKKLVEMVHEVEKNNRFFSKEELLSGVKYLLN